MKLGQESVELSLRASELFEGHDKNVVAAALADLVSVWIMSHFVENDRAQTTRARMNAVIPWLKTLEELIDINEAASGIAELVDGPATRH